MGSGHHFPRWLWGLQPQRFPPAQGAEYNKNLCRTAEILLFILFYYGIFVSFSRISFTHAGVISGNASPFSFAVTYSKMAFSRAIS